MKAFLSYAREDRKAARRLAWALERISRRWPLGRRGLEVVLDTIFPPGPNLPDIIRRHLRDAKWLLVLASPASAVSPWVDAEIRYWRATRGPKTIIIVRLDGTIAWAGTAFAPSSTALAPALLTAFTRVPLHAEIAGIRPTFCLGRYRTVIATIAHRMLRVPVPVLVRRAVCGCVLKVVVIAVIIGVGWIFLACSSACSRKLAERSRHALTSNELGQAVGLALAAGAECATPEAEAALVAALVRSRYLRSEIVVSDRAVTALAFTDGGKMLVAGDSRGALTFWRQQTGELAALRERAHPDGVTSIAVNPRRDEIATGGTQTHFFLWKGLQATPERIDVPGTYLAWTLGGDELIAAGNGPEGSTVSIIDARSRQVIRTQNVESPIVALAADRSGTRFATADRKGFVTLWSRALFRDPAAGPEAGWPLDAESPAGTAQYLDFSSNGSELLVAGANRIARYAVEGKGPKKSWDVEEKVETLVGGARFLSNTQAVLLARDEGVFLRSEATHEIGFHQGPIRSIAYHAATNLVATGAEDGTVRIWSLEPNHSFMRTHSKLVTRERRWLARSPSGATAVTARQAIAGGKVSVDVVFPTKTEGWTVERPLGPVAALAVSDNGSIAIADEEGALVVASRASARSVERGNRSRSVLDLSLSPDARWLAVAWAGGPAVVRDLDRPGYSVTSKTTPVTALGFGPSGADVVLATAAGRLFRWDPSKGIERPLPTFAAAESGYSVAGISMNGERIAIMSTSGQLDLRDVDSGMLIATLLPASAHVVDSFGVGLFEDGRKLTVSNDTHMLHFDFDASALRARAYEIVDRATLSEHSSCAK